jgi:hypothetical protein
VAAAYAVFQSLVGVLPQELSGDVARYALAGTAAVGVGVVVWLSALLARRRAERVDAEAEMRPPIAVLPAGPGELGRLAEGTLAALVRCRSTVEDPEVGRLTGWPHFVEEGEAG